MTARLVMPFVQLVGRRRKTQQHRQITGRVAPPRYRFGLPLGRKPIGKGRDLRIGEAGPDAANSISVYQLRAGLFGFCQTRGQDCVDLGGKQVGRGHATASLGLALAISSSFSRM